MDPQDLLFTALRASIIYFLFLMVIRLLGKRSVGNFGAFDLIVALILGEVVDEAIYGDVSMIKAVLVIVVVAAWHFINSWASYRSKTIHKLTEAEPAVLIKNGKIQPDALAKERLHEEELYSSLRINGIDDIKEVKEATLEPKGQISVLKEEWAVPIQKKDLPEQV
jgi:uncharacterized membrane protein YcaP (DUF421 family)